MTRYIQIDIAKGIGMLLVVAGHSWLVIRNKGELFNVIYSFHMPFFFLLSGLFFSSALPFGRLLLRRSDSLLKPYFVTCSYSGLLITSSSRSAFPTT